MVLFHFTFTRKMCVVNRLGRFTLKRILEWTATLLFSPCHGRRPLLELAILFTAYARPRPPLSSGPAEAKMLDSVDKKHSKNSIFGGAGSSTNSASRCSPTKPEKFNIFEPSTNCPTAPIPNNQPNQVVVVPLSRRNNNSSSRKSWIRNRPRRRSTTITSRTASTSILNFFAQSHSLDQQDRESRKSVRSIQGKFNSEHNSEDGSNIPLITKLDKYTPEELMEYRQVRRLKRTWNGI